MVVTYVVINVREDPCRYRTNARKMQESDRLLPVVSHPIKPKI